MQLADVPSKFNIPWAASAGGSFIRPIPEASQIGIQNGAASLTDGFPPDTFTPISAGGTPPFGQDTNGILNQITLWSQWQAAGGPAVYDAAFSTAIGGYPKGTVLNGTTTGLMWYSVVDDNTVDPNAGVSANWQAIGPYGQQQQPGNIAAATGTANVYAATFIPPVVSHQVGVPLRFTVPVSNNAGACTFNPGPGIKALLRGSGSRFFFGDLSTNVVYTAVYNGTAYVVQEFVSAGLAGAGQGSLSVSVANDAAFHTVLDLSTITSGGRALLAVTAVYAPNSESWDGLILAVQFASGTGAGNTPITNQTIQNAPGTVVFQVSGTLVQMQITGGGGTYAVNVKVVALM